MTGPPVETIVADYIANEPDAGLEGKAGRPGKRPPPDNRTLIWIASIVAAVAIGGAAIAIFVTLSSGGGTPGNIAAPTSTVQPAESPPAAAATPTEPEATAAPSPARALLTGTYSGSIVVDDDLYGHALYIGPMPGELDVFIGRDTSTRVVTLEISGDAPFIGVTSVGNYNETTGSFSATGSGNVTSRQIPVTATMDGTLFGGNLSASLTFTGTPNGPISYEIDMTKIAGP